MRKHLCEWCEGRIDCLVNDHRDICPWLRFKFIPPFVFKPLYGQRFMVDLIETDQVLTCQVSEDTTCVYSPGLWPDKGTPIIDWCYPYPFPV
jgi:hypothetical protein